MYTFTWRPQFAILLLILSTVAELSLIVQPIHSNVVLHCQSSVKAPIVISRVLPNSRSHDLYNSGGVMAEFREKIVVKRTREYSYTLTLFNVSVEDSGNYSCEDRDGLSRKPLVTIQLIVQDIPAEVASPSLSNDNATSGTTVLHPNGSPTVDTGHEYPLHTNVVIIVVVSFVGVLILLSVALAIIICICWYKRNDARTKSHLADKQQHQPLSCTQPAPEQIAQSDTDRNEDDNNADAEMNQLQ